jgi:glycosyltransferase involved in cell wall biosynthesis
MISVLILTKNEEQDLPGCLESVRWCDDIRVFDSFSTDRTVEIALKTGANVVQRQFDDWSSHQNWGLANIPFRHPWVFYLDADERVTPELRANLFQAVRDPAQHVAFSLTRRDFWGKRWLRHVVASSSYIRLFLPEKMRYERLVNPVSIPDGPVGELNGYLDHYPFSKGMNHWLTKHNSYSSFEAKQIEQNRERNRQFSILQAFLAKDPLRRRFHQKELLYRLPARPLIKFLGLYLGKRGFLDGRAGFNYAMLQSFYEYMIVLKTQELAACSISSTPVHASKSTAGSPSLEGSHANLGSDN